MAEVRKGAFESAPTTATTEPQAARTPLPTGKVTARCRRCSWGLSDAHMRCGVFLILLLLNLLFFLSLKFFFQLRSTYNIIISVSGVRCSDETFTYLPKGLPDEASTIQSCYGIINYILCAKMCFEGMLASGPVLDGVAGLPRCHRGEEEDGG